MLNGYGDYGLFSVEADVLHNQIGINIYKKQEANKDRWEKASVY